MRKWPEKLAERVSEKPLGPLDHKDKYSSRSTAAYENINESTHANYTWDSKVKLKKIKEAETEWNREWQAWSMKGT